MMAVLHGLLFLLKWLGILILVILGLLLLVVLTVLLVPIRYKGRLDKKEAPEEIFRADGLVSWLNPLLRVRVRFAEKKLHYTVRIFGICLLNSDKPKRDKPVKGKKKAKKAKEEKKKKQEPEKETTAESLVVAENAEGTETPEAEGGKTEATEQMPAEETLSSDMVNATATPPDEAEEATESAESGRKKKGSLFKKIKQIIAKIMAIPEKLKEKVIHIKNTVKLLWYKKDKVVMFLQDELHKTALGKAWDTVKQIGLHVLPGKIKGHLEFGTGDPESTGKALGVLGILYAAYGKGITVIPDFYEKRLVAELAFKGRIRLGTLLLKGVRLIRDKQVKRFIKNFKRLLKVLKQKAE